MPASAYPRAGVPVGAGSYWDGSLLWRWEWGAVSGDWGRGDAHKLPSVTPAALHHPREPGVMLSRAGAKVTPCPFPRL